MDGISCELQNEIYFQKKRINKMTIKTIQDLYAYFAKGMIKLFKNVGLSDEDIKNGFSEAKSKFKAMKLEDSDKVDEICKAVDEEIKNVSNNPK